jgi:cytidylate kinase
MDPIRVVTISRQTGSLGSEVSRLAAGQLGFNLVWREVINKAAMRAGSPEAALAAIDDLGILGICPSPKACLAYRQSVEALLHEYADQGQMIIIGRAGQVILKERRDAFHVRITAPLDVRVQRLVERHSITPEAAVAQIEASDSYRKKYMKRFYHCRWDDPDLYDLIINTGRLSAEEAASVIAQAVRLGHVESSAS